METKYLLTARTHIGSAYTSRYDAYDDISCILDDGYGSIFVSEAKVLIEYERWVAL
jgi:hypothetical protein